MTGASSGRGRPRRSTGRVIPMSSSSSTAARKAPSPCRSDRFKEPPRVAKAAARYVCQSCGASFPRWSGRCDSCGEWNTIVEEMAAEAAPKGLSAGRGRRIDLQPLAGETAAELRRQSEIVEFDRVVGGGLVKGSAILIGGDPGIGKSTLVLQVAAALGRSAPASGTIYISGEEAIETACLEARTLGLIEAPVTLAAANSIHEI